MKYVIFGTLTVVSAIISIAPVLYRDERIFRREYAIK